ncbi:MAG: hypothetical protein AB7O98_03020 [Hyphomonadaceae bacterium]
MQKEIAPARLTQLALAAGFLSFGVAWLAAPQALETMFARDHATAILPVVALTLGALAAHALAAGMFALIVRFKSWTFLGFAASLAPFFIADYMVYVRTGEISEMIFLHAGGMGVMVLMCLHGFRALRQREDAAEQAA